MQNIAIEPRPWFTRARGECAFPVDGRGEFTRSCCNPCGDKVYCPAHLGIAYTGPDAPLEKLTAHLRRLGLCA